MAGDANYSAVSLLLHGDGANNSTVFTDNSFTPKVLTGVSTAKISTAQAAFGGASILLNGSSGYLSAPYSADFDLPGDFTIEGFIYLTAYSASYAGSYGACLAATYNAAGGSGNLGWQVRVNGLVGAYNTINIYTGLTDLNVTGLSIALNTLHWLAISRTGSTISVYLNGTRVGTLTNSDSFTRNGASPLHIGHLNDTTFQFYLPGHIDELRITKGVGRYTGASVTVPAAAFPDGAGQVAGVITDSSGAPASRVVRVYRRDTGALIKSTTSDGGTGAYSVYTPTLDEVTVLALDSATVGTIYNDVCERVIPA